MKLELEAAREVHIEEICDLVNLAYRGKHGWTKETDLIGGDRLDVNEVKGYIENSNTYLLIALYCGEIVSCICIKKEGDSAIIGLFSVHPKLQGTGIGKIILSQAENYASTKLKIKKYVMVVVSQRIELISYYERRGYFRMGNIQEYPTHLNVGTPLKRGLTIEYLEKNASL